MDLGMLLLRSVIGSLFIGHGAQKLFGSFGGYGLEGTGGFMAQLGYRKGRAMATLAGFTELAAGVLLAIGFLTPIAAAGIIGVMVNAIVAVHAQNGMWNQDGGSEYPLVLCAAVAAITFAGPGAFSVDEALGLELAGVAWGFSAILLGILSGVVVSMSRRPAGAVRAETPGEERRRAA